MIPVYCGLAAIVLSAVYCAWRRRYCPQEVGLTLELISVCASCKKVRDQSGVWKRVSPFSAFLSGSRVSHGFCPECVRRLYPDMADKVLGDS